MGSPFKKGGHFFLYNPYLKFKRALKEIQLYGSIEEITAAQKVGSGEFSLYLRTKFNALQ